MNRWEYIGPVWNTETVYRILEIFRVEKIPYKMPFSDVFFTSYFHPVSKERRWGIMVRRKDWGKAVDVLAREGLVRREMLPAVEPETPAADRKACLSRLRHPGADKTGNIGLLYTQPVHRGCVFCRCRKRFFKNENVLKTVCSYLSLLLPANACYNI